MEEKAIMVREQIEERVNGEVMLTVKGPYFIYTVHSKEIRYEYTIIYNILGEFPIEMIVDMFLLKFKKTILNRFIKEEYV